MEPNEIITEKETMGWHRFIAYETGVLPTAVYFEGPRGLDRETSTLVVEVKQSSLEPEPIRFPLMRSEDDTRSVEERAAERFPLRRDVALTEDEFAVLLDQFVFIPFRLVVRPD